MHIDPRHPEAPPVKDPAPLQPPPVPTPGIPSPIQE
ncbi:hypothetical protein EDF71_110190 [Comamonas sp. JUb58]|jgi:hypothetical protein|nr:hypothetical protein EDF71_110190 [Comamonas sp. JUb58]